MKRHMMMLIGAILFLTTAFAQAITITYPGADPLDPAVMHIGNPPNTGAYSCGDEVRLVSDTTQGIQENGNGQPTLVNPLLLILGVPNMTNLTFTAPSITLSPGTGTIGGTNVFSGTWNTSTGYAGNFTAGNNDVYKFIGLDPFGNASNNFGNWHDADLAVNGIDASGFGIFVYTLTGTGITGGSTVDVTFGSPLAPGTFVVAYEQIARDPANSYTTPFTEAGLTTNNPLPEYATIFLLGSGLFGLAFSRRRSKA